MRRGTAALLARAWTVAQLSRGATGWRCIGLAGFEIYQPLLRERRRAREIVTALFPGYLFVAIELQWRAARWCPGVIRLVMDGIAPAMVPDTVIEAIRKRGGVICSRRSGPATGRSFPIVTFRNLWECDIEVT
jgi:hypothetical protein